jgi:hypothetical protein
MKAGVATIEIDRKWQHWRSTQGAERQQPEPKGNSDDNRHTMRMESEMASTACFDAQ